MAKVSDKMAKSFETEDTSGVLSWLLAEEDELDRRALWRLGSWAVASAAAVIVAVLANQSSMGMRRDQVASTDLARQSQLIEQVARDSQSEARRLASAVETLNGDRDRLYSRIAVLEHGLESVTGTISRQNPAGTSPQVGLPATSATQASTSQASLSQGPPSQGPLTQGSPREGSSSQASVTAPSTGPASANAGAVASPASPTIPAPAAAAVALSTEAPAAVAQKSSSAPAAPQASANGPAAAEKPPILASGPDPRVAPTSPAAPSASVPPVTPASPPLVSKSVLAPPDPAAPRLVEPGPAKVIAAAPIADVVASSSPSEDVKEQEAAATATAPALAVQRTEFGVDVGGANSIPGLRALWRGLLKPRSNGPLTALRPIIVIRENQNGLGMQLRLVAGPISDAAAAAKICASMIANDRPCTTAVFEGQRLVVNPDEAPSSASAEAKPASEAKPSAPRRFTSKRASPKEETAPKTDPSTVSSIFGRTSR